MIYRTHSRHQAALAACSLLLAVLSAPTSAAVHVFDHLFKADDAPMWGRTAGARLDASAFFGAEWDAQNFAPSLSVPGVVDAQFEASLTAGRMGFEVGLRSGRPGAGGVLDGNGSVDIHMPVKLSVETRDVVRPGAVGVPLSVGWSVGDAFRFTTEGPDLTAHLDVVANGGLSARLAGQVTGFSPYDSGTFEVVRFDDARARLATATADTAVQIDVPTGSVRLGVPASAGVSTSTRAGSALLKGSARTGEIVALNTDIDALVSAAIGLHQTFGVPGGPGVTVNPVSVDFQAAENTGLTVDYIGLTLKNGIKFAQDFQLWVEGFQVFVDVKDAEGKILSQFGNFVSAFDELTFLDGFNVPLTVAGDALHVFVTAYPSLHLVNNSGFVWSTDGVLNMFGATARLGGVVLYDQSLIEKRVTFLESDPRYIFGENVGYGSSILGEMSGSFVIPVRWPGSGTGDGMTGIDTPSPIPEPATWACLLAGACVVSARMKARSRT